VNDEIAPGVMWPATIRNPPGAPGPEFDFVHINEKGELSEALTKHFLPSRCENLQTIISPAVVGAGPEPEAGEGLDIQLGAAVEAFTQAEGTMARTQRLQDLELSVDRARSQDARSPGAFIPFRRTH
jgi:hypothetical protein